MNFTLLAVCNIALCFSPPFTGSLIVKTNRLSHWLESTQQTMKHSLLFVYYVYYSKEDKLLTQFPRDGFMRHRNLSVPTVGKKYWMNLYFTWWMIEWWFILRRKSTVWMLRLIIMEVSSSSAVSKFHRPVINQFQYWFLLLFTKVFSINQKCTSGKCDSLCVCHVHHRFYCTAEMVTNFESELHPM